MTSRLHVITALVALFAALGAAGCEARRRRTPDDTLVLVIETAMTTSDPRYAFTGYDAKLNKLANVGLTIVDSPSLEARLGLAAKVEHVDDLTWDVTLRADAKFSDGSAVTAADVAGTYHDVIKPGSDSPFHKNLDERFSDVEARGDGPGSVVRFHLRQPLATFITDIDFCIASYHGGSPPKGKAIGAGPYMLRELDSDHAVLDANPYYVIDHVARTPHVEIKFVRDAAARLLMLAGGSADMIQNALRYDLLDELRGQPRVHIESGPSVFLTYMLMNNTDPALRDVRVRRAIALALDRPGVIAAKFGGYAVLATGLLPPTHWAYARDMPRYDRDLARARQLLDEAGYPERPGAPRLSLVYKTSSDQFRVSIARVLAAQLGEVGIDVEVRAFEFQTFFADVKKGQYQLATMQTAEITEPDFYFTYFHSSWIPSAANPDGYNRWRYINADVDRLTEAGRRELDRDKRKVIYDEVQKIVARDVPIVPLWHEDNVVLSNIDVQGYTITPNARLVGLRDAWKRH